MYGLNYYTKLAVFTLIEQKIYIDGFLADDAETVFCQTRFLNKKVYTRDEILENDKDFLVIDVFGRNKEFLKKQLCNDVACLYEPINKGPVLVYGAGERGKKAYQLLSEMGIDVVAFCDRDPQKQKEGCLEKSVLNLFNSKTKYPEVPLIIGLSKNLAEDIADQWIHEKVYYYEDNLFMDRIVLDAEGAYRKFEVDTIPLYYHIQQSRNKKKLFLWGEQDRVIRLVDKLAYLDLQIDGAFSLGGLIGQIGNVRFFHPYKLLDRNAENIRVWALPEAEEQARKFLEKTGFDGKQWAKGNGIMQLYHDDPMDPNLGHNVFYHKYESVFLLKTQKEDVKRRIGVIGGSTSDVTALIEKSWPESLRDIAAMHHLSWEIYVGAVAGYMVSQELVKFVRDMIPLGIDTLVSYSRVNDWVASSRKSLFISQYQKEVFQGITGTHRKQNDTCIYGYQGYDTFEHWLSCERMLHAICEEFGIEFYGVMQPVLFEKLDKTEQERELMEHFLGWGLDEQYIEYLYNMRKNLKTVSSSYTWLYDFTEIFDTNLQYPVYIDHCHLTSYGNQIIASAIFDLIKGTKQ